MSQYKEGDIGGDWATIIEPESAANQENLPTSPFNNVMYCDSGHSFEMDGTKGRERIRLYHRSGSFIELHPDGQVVHKTYGNAQEFIVSGDKKIKVKGGHLVIDVEGNAAINVGGHAITKVGKSLKTLVDGDIDITSKNGAINLNADKVNLNTGKQGVNMTGSTMNVPSDFVISGSLSVGGSITAQGNIYGSSAVYSNFGFVTPGSILVGLLYAGGANLPTMATNVIAIDATAITMTAKFGALFKAFGAMAIGSGLVMEITSGTAMTIGSGAALSIGAAAALGITAGLTIGLGAVGNVSIGAASLLITSANLVVAPGYMQVTGIVNAADFFSLVNPMFYSMHVHKWPAGPTGVPTGIPLPLGAVT